jgi:hypothetical protein
MKPKAPANAGLPAIFVRPVARGWSTKTRISIGSVCIRSERKASLAVRKEARSG